LETTRWASLGTGPLSLGLSGGADRPVRLHKVNHKVNLQFRM